MATVTAGAGPIRNAMRYNDSSFPYPVHHSGAALGDTLVCVDANGNFDFTPLIGVGAAAPANAEYIVSALNGSLSAERVLTGTANQVTVTFTDGLATLSLPTALVAPGKVGIGMTPVFDFEILTASGTGTGGNSVANGINLKTFNQMNGLQLMHGSSTAFMMLNPNSAGSGAMGIGTKGNFPLYIYTNSGLTAGTPSTTGIRVTVTGTGAVGIGETSPLGKLHVMTADSGATANASYDEGVFENSGDAGISILGGTSSTCGIAFGDSGDDDVGKLSYSHALNLFGLTVNATQVYTFSDALGVFSVAIDVTTGASAAREALKITQGDTDFAFIDFVGNTGANATASISTRTVAVLNGFVQVEINGTKKWIPYYNDPTA